MASLVARKQFLQDQGVHGLVAAPQYHQYDDFQSCQRDGMIGKCHGSFQNQFSHDGIQHAGAFKEDKKAKAFGLEFVGFLRGIAAD